ncbi:MAG TPA: AIR synthase-related protein, partial [Candidatus Nanoarchaeia archaeon]|nr:AIR synthase-related protein [Candidatus Nanoarchaeia archaeon]
MKKQLTYADAGVDRDLGNEVSKILYHAAKMTWKNRKGRLGEVIVPFDDFSGVRAIDVSNLPAGTLVNMNFDGVGTKIEVAERMQDHATIAYDLFAMVCDDAVVRGGEPVLVGSILDVNALKDENRQPFMKEVKELARGYIDAAREANVAVVNGETAELGSRVCGFGNFNYNWGGAVLWFARRERMLTGHEVQEGDYLMGLREEGFRSNGISLARRVLAKELGNEWQRKWIEHDIRVGEALLRPSKIYAGAVVEMTGGYDGEAKAKVHGIAHITGGGIPEKLGRALKPASLGAVIEDAFAPNPLMLYCQRLGNVSDEEAYRTWNMGQGMIIVTGEPEDVIKVAESRGIEAKVIGKVTKESGIKIKSEGCYKRGEYLSFNS